MNILSFFDGILDFWTTNSTSILSVLVVVHLITEYFHYAWEFFTGRKENNLIKDILHYRKKSTKTTRLICLQCDVAVLREDIDLIKKKLEIED